MAGKIIFRSEQVKNLKQQMQTISKDTNRLRQMVNSATNSWSLELPAIGSLYDAQRQITKLTSDAEHLVEFVRKAIEGVEKAQEQSRPSSWFGEILSGIEEFFRRYGMNTAAALLFPPALGYLVNRLINDVTKEQRFNDEWKQVPEVKLLLHQLKYGSEQEKAQASSLLNEIYDARDNIARAQTAWNIYRDYDNEGLMDLAHQEAERSRQRLRDLGVDESYFDGDQTLSSFCKGAEINACSFDPSYTYNSNQPIPPVEMMNDNQYKYYLELGRKQDGKGDYARQLLSEIHGKFSEISRAQAAYGEYTERGMTEQADEAYNDVNGLLGQLTGAPYYLSVNHAETASYDGSVLKAYDPSKMMTLEELISGKSDRYTAEEIKAVWNNLSPGDKEALNKIKAENWWKDGPVRSVLFEKVVKPYSETMDSFFKNTTVGKFIQRSSEVSAGETFTGAWTSTGNPAADQIATGLGKVMEFATPLAGAETVQFAFNGLNTVLKNVATKVTKGTVKAGTGKTGEGLPLEKVKSNVKNQIHPDDNATYGYSPNKGTDYDRPEYDFTDVDWAKKQRKIREDYLEASKQLEDDITRMQSQGFSKEDIAHHVVEARNQQKVIARQDMTPEELAGLEARNIKKYGLTLP